MISIASKLYLRDSVVCKQVIWCTTVNNALRKLKKIKPLKRDKEIDNHGEGFLKNQILSGGIYELMRILLKML